MGVLAVIGFVGLYIPYQESEKNRTATPIPDSGGAVTVVTYTNDGFEPRQVTVLASTSVEWTNRSDKLMWIASDPHPSHTDLPGFDEQGVEGNERDTDLLGNSVPIAEAHVVGGIYRYTFLKKGVWKYHNHLLPSDRGSIIVE